MAKKCCNRTKQDSIIAKIIKDADLLKHLFINQCPSCGLWGIDAALQKIPTKGDVNDGRKRHSKKVAERKQHGGHI